MGSRGRALAGNCAKSHANNKPIGHPGLGMDFNKGRPPGKQEVSLEREYSVGEQPGHDRLQPLTSRAPQHLLSTQFLAAYEPPHVALESPKT